MKKILCLGILCLGLFSFGQQQYAGEIAQFQKQDSLQQPQEGVVLFVGSSSFRLWTTMATDFHNPKILNRGFGGATLNDILFYEASVLLKYKPSKIVFYCGENDIAADPKVTPEAVLLRFQTLFTHLRKAFPQVPFYFVGIKPCTSRWAMRDRMQATNQLIENYLATQSATVFISVWEAMLENSVPNPKLFREDQLHMNALGYAIWIKALAPYIQP
ncbi:MAG: hypothetical protein RLZZ500_1821 [Bacteroidota bacterium]|jgi:lysophospholipase L1-like esterase